MATVIYISKETGDLKFIAEVEDEDRPDFALDALLDENLRVTRGVNEFVALVTEDGESGTFVSLTLDDDAPLDRPKRAIRVSANGAAAEVEDEEDAPAPKRTARKKAPAKAAPAGRTELTDELMEEAIQRHNVGGEAMAQIAKALGVSSPGYLARRIRETYGADVLVKPGDAPAPKAKAKRTTAKKAPAKKAPARKKAPAKRGGSPFKTKPDDD